MAQKKIDIKFNVDDKSVKIAGEETMRLTQQVRLLKAELASGKYSQEEFDMLSNKLDNVQERMEATRARSGDLLTSLQLIPGPIGDIAAKFNGAISVLQQFSKFSFADLQTQFKKTIDDIKDIGKSLLTNTGISAAYDLVNRKLAAGFVAVGVGEQAAAVGARAFAAALAATGIGLLVVALGSAVSMLMEFAEGSDEAAVAQERLSKQIATTNQLLDMDLADAARRQKIRMAEMKRDGKSEKEIRDQNLLDLQENLGLINIALEDNLKKEAQVQKTGEGELKDVYAARYTLEEKQAQLIADIREKEINNEIDANKERESQRQKNLQSQQKANDEALKLEQERIRKQQEAANIQKEAELSLLELQDREILERTIRFTNELVKLKEAGITDFTNLEEEYRLDVAAIDDKYNKERIQKQKDLQNQLKTLQSSQTETLLDDAQVEVEIVNQKYAALIEAAKKNNEDTKLLETLQSAEIQKIRTDAENAETLRLATEAEKRKQDNLKLLQDEQSYEQQRFAMKAQTLDGIIQLAGAETAVGRAALVAKQIILAKELVLEVKKNIAFSKSALARSQVAVAEGTAQTAKIGFPQNIIPLALYAVQAASIIGSIISATRASKTSIDIGGLEAGAAPAAPPTGVVARRNQGGFVYGEGGSITDSIPTMLSNGEFVMNAKSAAMFSPMLMAMNNTANLPNTTIPKALGNQSLIDVMAQNTNNRPIKTYVTAQDMSNQQQFDRTIKSRSLI